MFCSGMMLAPSRMGNFAHLSRSCIKGSKSSSAVLAPPQRRVVLVRASTDTEDAQRKKELVGQIKESLKATGLDEKAARVVLENWSAEVGHEVTPDDLRKILVGQSTKALILVFINTLLDSGAAYGSFVAGNFLGLASEQYGLPAVIGQAIAYALAGYYVAGAAFDFFKLGTVLVARLSFDVNSGAFLEAIEGIAGSSGLGVADKARDAVNSVKVLNALTKMSDLLKQQNTDESSSANSMLADLGAYLTLDKAQKLYGFDATEQGLSDDEAATVAIVFGRYDINNDGVLNEDEFRKLCVKYAPELSTSEEINAALRLIDTNKDGSIQFTEFVKFWKNQIKDDVKATASMDR